MLNPAEITGAVCGGLRLVGTLHVYPMFLEVVICEKK